MDRGAFWATVHGTEKTGHNSVTKQQLLDKYLYNSTHIHCVISVCHSLNYPYVNI